MLSVSEAIARVAAAPKFALVTDLDGSLVPFDVDPERAAPSPAVVRILDELAGLPDTLVVVASGRRQQDLERFFGRHPRIELVAEHGLWIREHGVWRMTADAPAPELDRLAEDLTSLASKYEGAWIELKTRGVVLHVRAMVEPFKHRLLGEAAPFFDRSLSGHPTLERLDGDEVIEIRIKGVTKARAIQLVHKRVGDDVTIMALGDDVTDEDMFRALSHGDVGVHIGPLNHPTAAEIELADTSQAIAMIAALLVARREEQGRVS